MPNTVTYYPLRFFCENKTSSYLHTRVTPCGALFLWVAEGVLFLDKVGVGGGGIRALLSYIL